MSVAVLDSFLKLLTGIAGGIYFGLAHGIVSPALFMSISALYDRISYPKLSLLMEIY
jgi:NADH:ubiquinone oxidoreductase subunit 4 (subunit M)